MSSFNCPINICPKKWLREISDTFLTHFHILTYFRQISVEFWRHFLFLLFYYLPTIILLSSGRHLREISEIFGTNIRAEYQKSSLEHGDLYKQPDPFSRSHSPSPHDAIEGLPARA